MKNQFILSSIITFAVMVAQNAGAAGNYSSGKSYSTPAKSSYSSYSKSSKSMAASAAFGFGPGGFAVGGDFEMMKDDVLGLGGTFRLYTGDEKKAPQGFSVLAIARPHLIKDSYDIYITPGVGFMSLKYLSKSDFILVGGMSAGFMMNITDDIGAGIESNLLVNLINDDYRGLTVHDWVVKGKFSF